MTPKQQIEKSGQALKNVMQSNLARIAESWI